MARGNNGQEVFPETKDYEVFIDQLGEVRRRYPFHYYAYVDSQRQSWYVAVSRRYGDADNFEQSVMKEIQVLREMINSKSDQRKSDAKLLNRFHRPAGPKEP